MIAKRRKGRPTGHRLSEQSKRAISNSKKGKPHTQETRDKISKSLIEYFNRIHPLSNEITNSYKGYNHPEIAEWINNTKGDIDTIDDVKTERAMHNINKIEIAYGSNIDFCSHNLTPEELISIKQECITLEDINMLNSII